MRKGGRASCWRSRSRDARGVGESQQGVCDPLWACHFQCVGQHTGKPWLWDPQATQNTQGWDTDKKMQTQRYTDRGQSKCKCRRILNLMLASCIRSRHLVPQTQEHCLQGNLAQDALIESDWTWALVGSYVTPQQKHKGYLYNIG